MADVQYTIHLDDDQVLQALRIIDQSIRKVANDGDQAFEKVSKSAKVSGIQIGAVSGIVQELTRRFIDMAAQAARAFVEVAKGGVEINRQAELTKLALTAIFEGNEQAADAFIARFEGLADSLRTDRQEIVALAKSLLPDVGDVDQLEEILKNAALLGKDAGKNFGEIKRALEEAAVGQFVSMERILNVPKESIRRIKDLAKEIGLGAALAQVLGERVTKAGLNIENTIGSLDALFAAANARGRDIQKIFGKPVFKELKVQAEAFLDVLDEHQDEIELVAVAFGDMVAAVVKFVGTNLVEFIDNLNFEQLVQIADDMQRALAAADLFVETLMGAEFSQNFLNNLQQVVRDVQIVLLTLAQISALAQAEIARRQAEAASLQQRGLGTRIGPVVISENDPQSRAAGEEAYNQVLQDQLKLFDEYEAKLAEINQRAEERAEAGEEMVESAEAEGEAIVKLKKLHEDLIKAQDEAAESQEKLNEAFGEAATDLERKRTEILIQAGRKRLDDEIKNAEKREDLARKNAEKIEDILREQNQAIDDAARDLTRDEEDIVRKAARDRGEIERDSARERIDVETEFRRELERIRARFNESAAEAERHNDAQAFLEAVRQRDRDVVDARRTRDESLEDAATRAQEQRAKLQEQLAFEIEDAHIANARKLEDLQLRLGRELEEQRLGYQRQIDEQTLAEARQREQRQREFQQELEDFARKEGQRLQDLQRSLNKEIEMIAKAEQLKRQIRVQEAQATVAQVNAIMAGLFGGRPTGATATPPYYYRGAEQRQYGGDVEPGRPYIVGERGPEMFVPDQRGTVVPNAAIGPGMTNISHAYDYSRRMDVGGISVGEDMFSNPVAVRRLENIILGIMARVA